MNNISGNIQAVFMILGTTNVHQNRNKMTPLVLLPWQQFCRWCCISKNRNSLFCLKTRTIYPTQPNDGSEDDMELCLFEVRPFALLWRLRMGIFTFLTERDWSRKSSMATAVRVSFCFFFDAHLWCQVSRTLLQYFQRYRLFSIFHFLVANNMTSSLI